MAGNYVTTYRINDDGFPKVVYAAMVRLGILDHPEYVGREYVVSCVECCEVTVHIGPSDKFLEMKPWSVSIIM
jgi:hypothetical protein